MGMTVGAALKKAAVALLANRKVWKTIGMTILVLAVAVIMPLLAFLALLHGTIELDVGMLQQQIIANLSAEDRAMLEGIESTMEEIRTAFKDAGMPNRVGEAQAVYIMALYDHARQPGFVSRLLSCFSDAQSDQQLVNAINREFGSSITVEEYSNVVSNIRSTYIDLEDYYDPTKKNNLDLVQWAKEADAAGWGYVLGTYGQVLSRSMFEAKLAQYPDDIGPYKDFILSHWLGKRTADCIGLIKGYCWFNPDSDTIGYATNGMPDISTEQIYSWASQKGSMSSMPEVPGIILWKKGHVGIYIGGGYVIEALGTRYGVIRRSVSSGGWTHWLMLPCIEYVDAAAQQ